MSFQTGDGATDRVRWSTGQTDLQAPAVASSEFRRANRKRLTRKAVNSVAIAALLAAGAWWLRDVDEAGDGSTTSPDTPSLEAEDVQRLVVREAGRKVWECAAARITISPDRRFAVATGVRRAVLFRNDKPYLQLQAQQVRLNQQTRDMEATGAVSAWGADGFKLRTERAVWTHRLHQLHCPTPVDATLRDPKVQLRAQQVRLDQRTHDLEASGGVKAHGADGLEIRTERALWTHRLRRLNCPSTVQAKMRDLTVQTRGVFYDAQQGRLRCPQPVQVSSPHVTLRGTHAVADVKSQNVELGGETEVVVRR